VRDVRSIESGKVLVPSSWCDDLDSGYTTTREGEEKEGEEDFSRKHKKIGK
jgi:hypothetical protein